MARFLVLLLVGLLSGSCKRREEVVVFHAASLRRALADAKEIFEREHPNVAVRLEPSGSLVAARKIAELGLAADLVAIADANVIDRMLVPRHASFNVEFAAGAVVLAHKDHSRFTEEITSESWPEVLERPGVRVGRADPTTAPLGYHTLFVLELAASSSAASSSAAPSRRGLPARLTARIAREHVAVDETELLALLESRAVDYAFLYRSTAEDHHLKVTALGEEVDLSRRELATRYASVSVRVGTGERSAILSGAPITYGLTIPTGARNPAGARAFTAFLLGDGGRRVLERAGFAPLRPAPCRRAGSLPAELRPLVEPIE